MQNAGSMRSRLYGIASAYALVNLNCSGSSHADPCGLQVEHLEQGIIILVQQNRSSRSRTQPHRAPHMVDMRMRDNDLLHLQIMLSQQRQDVLNIVARIDHHRFARALVANDRAIAL